MRNDCNIVLRNGPQNELAKMGGGYEIIGIFNLKLKINVGRGIIIR